MRWSMSGLGALVGVLVITGCGSAEKKEYLREANAICAAAGKRLGETKRPSSLEGIADDAEREIGIREDALTKLGELTVPPDVKGGAAELSHDLEERQKRAEAIKRAAEGKHRAELRKIEHEGRTEFGVEAERARAFGVPACAEL